MSTDTPLGTTSIDTFLGDYWQRKPLLVRAGIPNLALPFDADDLAGLSLQPEVESRLVTCHNPAEPNLGYHLSHGPLEESLFESLGEENWTLLVQAVELWIPELKSVLDYFRFLPPWRLDDIMVSYATPGGGVGPHFDSYDVFLIQATGQRRWRIGQACDDDTALVHHSDISTLAEFECSEEWLLNPGDLLYVPPGIAHWGTAETDGITLSVGFRSPSLNELLDDLTVEVMADAPTTHLRDPSLTTAMASTNINPAYIAEVRKILQTLIDDEQRLGQWLAQFMTRPKYPELLELTQERREAEFNGVTYVNGEPAEGN